MTSKPPSAPCDCEKVHAGMATLNADHDRLVAENRRLREAFDELWEVATDMRPYVPDYFAAKWHHDRDLAAAKEMRDA